mmetsp:Transcript_16702/g.39322  ORF Transcript_16702/g.39322 Transcript_16702/m.39322 type:complete len:128 (+) Transcript_16702:1115-1498(+)
MRALLSNWRRKVNGLTTGGAGGGAGGTAGAGRCTASGFGAGGGSAMNVRSGATLVSDGVNTSGGGRAITVFASDCRISEGETTEESSPDASAPVGDGGCGTGSNWALLARNRAWSRYRRQWAVITET